MNLCKVIINRISLPEFLRTLPEAPELSKVAPEPLRALQELPRAAPEPQRDTERPSAQDDWKLNFRQFS